MHPGLAKLLRLRLWAGLRRLVRGMRKPRNAAFGAIGMLMMVWWLGSILLSQAHTPQEPPVRVKLSPEPVAGRQAHTPQEPQEPAVERFRTFFPPAMLALAVLQLFTAGGQRTVHFSPAEVDFLFAGPFTRRQLLVYKLAITMPGAAVAGLMFSIVFLRYAHTWVAACVGFWLALVFSQLLTMAFMLLGQTAGQYAFTRARKIALLAVVFLVGVALVLARVADPQADLTELVRGMRDSVPGRAVLAPFTVFARTITAGTVFPELIGWGSLALAINAATLTLVLWLDVNYLEAETAASQALYERLQRMRRTGSALGSVRTARGRVPMLPWLGGSGPILRKQLLRAVRSTPHFLIFAAVMAAAFALNLGVGRGGGGGGASHPMGAIFGLLFMLTFVALQMLNFDFRGDLDHFDWLKSLPIRPAALAAGQVAAPTLALTAIHLAVLACCAPFMPGSQGYLALAALFVLPCNAVLFGLENLLFLLFPARMELATAGSFQAMGRMIVLVFLKVLVAGVFAGVAVALGGAAYLVSGGSWAAALGVAWLTAAAMAIALLFPIAWAFRRFDVSADTPP